MVWWHPLVATFAVSIVPVLLLTCIPNVLRLFQPTQGIGKASRGKGGESEHQCQPRLPLSLMMCFAAGSLLADAASHLAEHPSETTVNWTLGGILLFMLVDKFSRYAGSLEGKGGRRHNVGYLSLFADAVHNFTDGLAISAAFGRSLKAGMATTFAIFLHEIPHELGDYAVLAKAGYGHGRIVELQLLTGLAAFAGTLVGLGIEAGILGAGLGGGDVLVPLTCGGFLYLGLCTILSEVMADGARTGSVVCMISDIGAFCLGMLVLRLLES